MNWKLGFVLVATLRDPLGPRTRLKASSQASQWGRWPRPDDAASISSLTDGRQAIATQTRRAVNLVVKKVLRVAHGFRSFKNFRLRVLLHCGVEWHTPPAARIRGRSPRLVA
jgi:transposase